MRYLLRYIKMQIANINFTNVVCAFLLLLLFSRFSRNKVSMYSNEPNICVVVYDNFFCFVYFF